MAFIDPVSRFFHNHAGKHGPLMLMYHSVSRNKTLPDWPWAVSMQRFRDQLDFLVAEGYQTPTMEELATAPRSASLKRSVVITFDDGYQDNLDACEELKKRGMRATWFIVSGSVGKTPGWPEDGRPAGRLLDASELRDMQSAGMEIGSHTVNHARLTTLDDAQMKDELLHSKASLEALLGKPVNSFAYPYGSWDARCVEAVEQAGYTAACTTRTGWALRDQSPFQLRRLTIFNTDTLSSFARKLYFGSHEVSWRKIAAYALRRTRRG